MNNVDTDGESIYMLFYTSGNSNNGDETFLAAAETRKQNIEHSSNFNSEKDIVIMQSLQDMAMMSSFVEQIISDYSSQYGRTIELGVCLDSNKENLLLR